MEVPKLRVAINGFGRIGRNVLRAWFESGCAAHIDVVAINDIADPAVLAHLLQFDTTHGHFNATVALAVQSSRNVLTVTCGNNSHVMQLLQIAQPDLLPWQALNVDLVLECTGQFRSRSDATKHLMAGAGRVVIGAAPFDTVDAAVVYGVNQHSLSVNDRIISSVSCTTQALVPLVKILDNAFGIVSALMTEIHAMTTDQSVLDHAHRDLRRARSASHNIIPTTSSALAALTQVLPSMAGKIAGYSLRVPTINVAAIDLSFVTAKPLTVARINTVLEDAAQSTQYNEIMSVCTLPLVSSDFCHQPYSLIVDSLQTTVVNNQSKVLVWYDNEWAYACRMLGLCDALSRLTCR